MGCRVVKERIIHIGVVTSERFVRQHKWEKGAVPNGCIRPVKRDEPRRYRPSSISEVDIDKCCRQVCAVCLDRIDYICLRGCPVSNQCTPNRISVDNIVVVVRGGGGARCMSMPVRRKKVEW